MATTRITTYTLSAGGTVTNAANAYDTNDSTTYATHSKNTTNGTTTCDWYGFAAVQASSATLYVYFAQSGTFMDGAMWEYSTNGGSSWQTDPNTGGVTSGSVSLGAISDLSQVRVRTTATRSRYFDDVDQIWIPETSISLLYGAYIDYQQSTTITGVSPTSWYAGDPVTLTGTNMPNSTPYIDHPSYGTYTGSVVEYNGTTNVAVTFPAIRMGSNPGYRIGSSAAYTPTGSILPPYTLSVSPTRVRRGATITLSGQGGYYPTAVNNIYFAGGNGVSQTSFSITSNTSLTVTVPSNAYSGNVWARNQWNEGMYSSPYLTVFFVSHGSSSAKLTSTVNVFGEGFVNISGVTLNGSSCSYTVDSQSQITITIPDLGFPDKCYFQVTSDLGTETCPTPFSVIKPLTTGASASTVSVGGYVEINGVYFLNNGALSVMWPNGVASTAYVISDTKVYTYVPAGAGGTSGAVYVRNIAGGSGSVNITTRAVPSISSFTPSSGRNDQTISISGTNLDSGGVLDVRIGGVSQSYGVASSSLIYIYNPTASGYISVITSGGTATSATQFTYLVPNITTISPNPANQLGTIYVTGTNFTGATSLLFPGSVVQTALSVVNDGYLYTTVPDGVGSGIVFVRNTAGTGGTGFNLTITDTPTVTGGPATGRANRQYTFTGQNLDLITTCDCGGYQAVINTKTATSITVTLDLATESGWSDIYFNYPGGQATYPFTVLNPYSQSVSPTTAYPGSTITVTGLRFSPELASIALVGPANYYPTATILSDTQATAVLPPEMGPGNYIVTADAYSGNNDGDPSVILTVLPPPGSPAKKSAINCRI